MRDKKSASASARIDGNMRIARLEIGSLESDFDFFLQLH